MDTTKKSWLTAAFVRSVSRPGVYGDKHGLRLRVFQSRKRKSISKQWVWRDTINGVCRDVGLGGFPYVTLLRPGARPSSIEKSQERGAIRSH